MSDLLGDGENKFSITSRESKQPSFEVFLKRTLTNTR